MTGERFSRALIEPKTLKDSVKKDIIKKILTLYNNIPVGKQAFAALAGVTESELNSVVKYFWDDFTVEYLLNTLETLAVNIKANVINIPSESLVKKIPNKSKG